MQTDWQKHKDTYKHGRSGEDGGDAGGVGGVGGMDQPGEPREGETKRVGWREGRSEESDGESGHKGGSLLFLLKVSRRKVPSNSTRCHSQEGGCALRWATPLSGALD